MLPPGIATSRPQVKRRHVYCAECGEELGILRRLVSSDRRYLYLTGVVAVCRHSRDTRTWLLFCPAKHVTEWHGIGVDWRQDIEPNAA